MMIPCFIQIGNIKQEKLLIKQPIIYDVQYLVDILATTNHKHVTSHVSFVWSEATSGNITECCMYTGNLDMVKPK